MSKITIFTFKNFVVSFKEIIHDYTDGETSVIDIII